MLNLKDKIAISAQVWGLLLFRNTLREGSVIYPKQFLSEHGNVRIKLVK